MLRHAAWDRSCLISNTRDGHSTVVVRPPPPRDSGTPSVCAVVASELMRPLCRCVQLGDTAFVNLASSNRKLSRVEQVAHLARGLGYGLVDQPDAPGLAARLDRHTAAADLLTVRGAANLALLARALDGIRIDSEFAELEFDAAGEPTSRLFVSKQGRALAPPMQQLALRVVERSFGVK